MAHGEDTEREIAECLNCGEVYPVWVWPDGEVNVIGRDGCSCGSQDFDVISTGDDFDTPADVGSE